MGGRLILKRSAGIAQTNGDEDNAEQLQSHSDKPDSPLKT
jgi:hypothetical protein